MCIKCANDCLLRSAGLNSPAGGGKKREGEKKRDFLQQSCDANKSRRWKRTRINATFLSRRDHAKRVQPRYRCNASVLLHFFSFYLNFLLTRRTTRTSTVSARRANVPRNAHAMVKMRRKR